jgi:hypothetical protein
MSYGYRFRQEQLDRISEFLLKSPGMAFCDECLRTALEVTRTMVPERSMSENAAARGFVRQRATCAHCRKTAVVTTASANKH